MIQTLARLLVYFRDNLTRNITPTNMQDFAESAFGALQSSDPTVNDDDANSAGNGYFDFGSRWINNSTDTIWECLDGTTGAAAWVQIYPQGGGLTIPTCQWWIRDGTPLAGLYSIGILPITAGMRILTWDGSIRTTLGIWIAQSGAWTRAPDFPAGTTFDGPAYVWAAYNNDDFTSYAQLLTLYPATWTYGTNPSTWTLGVDDALVSYAVPTAIVTAGTFIRISEVEGAEVPVQWNVSYNGPISLDQWFTAGGPLDPANLGTGSLPGTVGVPPGNLTSGTIPSGTLLPAPNLTGTVPTGNLPTLDTIAAASGDLSAANVGSGYPYADLSGAPGAINTSGGDVTILTTNAFATIINFTAPSGLIGVWQVHNNGPNTARVQVTTVDPIMGSQVQTTGLGTGSNTQPQDVISNGGLANTCEPPLTSITVEVQSFVAGNPTTVRVRWAMIAVP